MSSNSFNNHSDTSDLKRLALFDLDDTILAGDSDYLWGLFLIEQGIVKKEDYFLEHSQFKQDYLDGKLDIVAYQKFSSRPLTKHPIAYFLPLREQFSQETLLPLCRPEMLDIMRQHQKQGETVIIITATNHFVVGGICQRLPADTFLATLLEESGGYFTGHLTGTPSFQAGKVTRIEEWIASHPGHTLEGSTFYSDSFNDRFLLEHVTNPVVVNGDDKLLAHAREHNWKTLSFS